MAGQRVGLLNFSKGELAPELHARHDVAAYSAGVKKARNVRIMKYGGLTKRPGTRFVIEARIGGPESVNRLIPFQFSFEQAYALEMGQGYMRPAANGGMVLEEELAVVSIQNALNPIVNVQYHGYVVGDHLYFTGIAGMTELNNNAFWRVNAVIDQHNFQLEQSTVAFGVFTGNTGGITRVGAPAAPPAPPVIPPVATPPPAPEVTEYQLDPWFDFTYGGNWFP
jgi:hypothetical protein